MGQVKYTTLETNRIFPSENRPFVCPNRDMDLVFQPLEVSKWVGFGGC